MYNDNKSIILVQSNQEFHNNKIAEPQSSDSFLNTRIQQAVTNLSDHTGIFTNDVLHILGYPTPPAKLVESKFLGSFWRMLSFMTSPKG